MLLSKASLVKSLSPAPLYPFLLVKPDGFFGLVPFPQSTEETKERVQIPPVKGGTRLTQDFHRSSLQLCPSSL